MSNEPDTADREALVDASVVLKYATETKLTLTNEMALSIFQAREAAEEGKWLPEVTAKFWSEFSNLCSLVYPATVVSIYANLPTIPRSSWYTKLFNARSLISLAERTAQRYSAIMLSLFVVITVVTYTVNAADSGIDSMNKILSNTASTTSPAVQAAALLRADANDHEKAFGKLTFAVLRNSGGEDQRRAIEKMEQNSLIVRDTLRRAVAEASAPALRLSVYGYIPQKIRTDFAKEKSTEPANSISEVNATLKALHDLQSLVQIQQPRISGDTKFINQALLPALLGLLGACAYIVRLISDQMKTTTFTRTSTTRHLVRLSLGALAGIIIGFINFAGTPGGAAAPQFSTAALSFLAGYAIDPVFALLDNLAATLRGIQSGAH